MKRPVAVAVAIPFPVPFADRITFFLPREGTSDAWDFMAGPMLFVGIMATIVAFLLAVS
ncbi:MAG: hypothetical protein WB493_17950 [Anaeromyxobacteraceae bacterium]